jgi:hypothetical protein
LWILGEPALEACDEFGDLASWPPSPRTDYFDLAGKSLTGTCRRAAELANEKVGQGVGQKFLEEMELEEPTPRKSPPSKSRPLRDEIEEQEVPRGHHEERYEEHYEKDGMDRDLPEQEAGGGRKDEGRRNGKDDEPDGFAPVGELADGDLEEIGRQVLELVSRIRSRDAEEGELRRASDDSKQKEGA